MLKIYDEKMNALGFEEKKKVHQLGLWHKTVGAIVFNLQSRKLYFQTIYPKDNYTFERADYIDFAVGGHVENDEQPEDTLKREMFEELGWQITDNDFKFIGMRVCKADLSATYVIREFQYFYAIETKDVLKNMDFSLSDGEVKSVVEVDADDFLALLMGRTSEICANEMQLDKNTRAAIYVENICINSARIVPDYFKDKSILEMMLSVKSIMCD